MTNGEESKSGRETVNAASEGIEYGRDHVASTHRVRSTPGRTLRDERRREGIDDGNSQNQSFPRYGNPSTTELCVHVCQLEISTGNVHLSRGFASC